MEASTGDRTFHLQRLSNMLDIFYEHLQSPLLRACADDTVRAVTVLRPVQQPGVILGQVLSIATCGSRTHAEVTTHAHMPNLRFIKSPMT